MSKSEYTPKPWVIDDQGTRIVIRSYANDASGFGHQVAIVPAWWNAASYLNDDVPKYKLDDEQRASANVLAAAPDLLEALESMRHDDGCFCEAAFAVLGQIIHHSPECIMACRAIDKAKGE